MVKNSKDAKECTGKAFVPALSFSHSCLPSEELTLPVSCILLKMNSVQAHIYIFVSFFTPIVSSYTYCSVVCIKEPFLVSSYIILAPCLN